jgi:hypothetical protein
LEGGIEDATQAMVALDRLIHHPWVKQVVVHVGGAANVLPIGDLFIATPRTDKLKIAMYRHPDRLWNRPTQAIKGQCEASLTQRRRSPYLSINEVMHLFDFA